MQIREKDKGKAKLVGRAGKQPVVRILYKIFYTIKFARVARGAK